jgi:glycosyltransferase involved in cell wall biosynthesis
MNPKVSLILTVHNREQYLEEALTSVQEQAYPDYELILWDDGSTDNSGTIAANFATHDPRIRYFSSYHQGRNAALRAAHQQAQGQYLGWIDGDDRLTPATLAATVAFLETEPDIGMVYTNHQIIDKQGNLKGYGHRCQIPYSKERLLVDFMTFHFRLMRRESFEQAGGINPYFESAIDYDLCLRLSEVRQIRHLQVPLYEYRNPSPKHVQPRPKPSGTVCQSRCRTGHDPTGARQHLPSRSEPRLKIHTASNLVF